MRLLSFTTAAVTKTYIEIQSVYYLTGITITYFWLNSNCLLCSKSVVSSSSSSETMCELNECAQPPCQCLPLQTSEMGDIHVYFIRSMAPTPRSVPRELHNLHKNSAAGLFRKIHNVNWPTLRYGWNGFEQCTIDNATDEV